MALSTSITVVTRAGLSSHHHYRVRDLDSVGVATFSNFKTGSSNLHSTGLTVGDTFLHSTGVNLGTGATVSNNGNATFSGIITATSFHGDISQATGAAAGLGTALSQTQTDPLNKIYYTDKVLSISTTQTIDHPATANLAYTQYGDIKIEDGHDLIIKDGDDFKYDILGISTTKIPSNQFPSGLSGDLTGNVTGNLTGNVTGNLTGNVTGTASNTSGATGDFSIADKIVHTGDTNTTIRFPSDDTFTVETGGTERLRIDSSGNLTKPTSFHILVNRNGDQTGYTATGTTGAIIWNRVITSQSSPNAANHFNTSTGIFTAPVTGYYYFQATVHANFTVQESWLIINGSRQNYSNVQTIRTGTSPASIVITYKLTAGDEVGLKWYENGGTNRIIYANDLITWWRIVLLG